MRESLPKKKKEEKEAEVLQSFKLLLIYYTIENFTICLTPQNRLSKDIAKWTTTKYWFSIPLQIYSYLFETFGNYLIARNNFIPPKVYFGDDNSRISFEQFLSMDWNINASFNLIFLMSSWHYSFCFPIVLFVKISSIFLIRISWSRINTHHSKYHAQCLTLSRDRQ